MIGASAQPIATPDAEGWRRFGRVSHALHDHADRPHGTTLLPRDLTAEQLRAATVLVSLDSLVIDELSEDEDDAFADAIGG